MENWKDIPGYEGRYQVSDLGNVRSVDRYVRLATNNGATQRLAKGRLLRPGARPSGHTTVALGKRNSVGVHQLVLLAFVGPCPAGHEVLHDDHKPANNVLTNLRYGTRSENLKMDYAAGNRVGNQHPNFIGARWRA